MSTKTLLKQVAPVVLSGAVALGAAHATTQRMDAAAVVPPASPTQTMEEKHDSSKKKTSKKPIKGFNRVQESDSGYEVTQERDKTRNRHNMMGSHSQRLRNEGAEDLYLNELAKTQDELLDEMEALEATEHVVKESKKPRSEMTHAEITEMKQGSDNKRRKIRDARQTALKGRKEFSDWQNSQLPSEEEEWQMAKAEEYNIVKVADMEDFSEEIESANTYLLSDKHEYNKALYSAERIAGRKYRTGAEVYDNVNNMTR